MEFATDVLALKTCRCRIAMRISLQFTSFRARGWSTDQHAPEPTKLSTLTFEGSDHKTPFKAAPSPAHRMSKSLLVAATSIGEMRCGLPAAPPALCVALKPNGWLFQVQKSVSSALPLLSVVRVCSCSRTGHGGCVDAGDAGAHACAAAESDGSNTVSHLDVCSWIFFLGRKA